MTRNEEPIHKAIVQYLRATLPHGWIVQHTRNGGMSKGENGRAKAMGAIAGWPDIALYGQDENGAPRSWFLEVKAPKGSVSSDQRKVHDRLKDIGFPVAVVRSIDDVLDIVRFWGLPSKDAAVNDNADTWIHLGTAVGSVLEKMTKRAQA